MIRNYLGACLVAMLAIASPAQAKGEKGWDTASSIGSYGLAAAALFWYARRYYADDMRRAAVLADAIDAVEPGPLASVPCARPA